MEKNKECREERNHGIFFGFEIIEKVVSRRYSDYFINNETETYILKNKNFVILPIEYYGGGMDSDMFYNIYEFLNEKNIELVPISELEIKIYQLCNLNNKTEKLFINYIKNDNFRDVADEFIILKLQGRFSLAEDYIRGDYHKSFAKFEHYCYYDSPYATPKGLDNFMSSPSKEYYLVSLKHINNNIKFKNYFNLIKGGIPKENNFHKNFIRVFK